MHSIVWDLGRKDRFLPPEILLGYTSHCFAVRLASLAQDDTGDTTVYVSS